MAEHSDASRDVRRVDLVLWCIVGALLVVALGAAIGILQREVYSPKGLVTAYVNAIADHDTTRALEFPGVAADGKRPTLQPQPSTELLRRDLLSTITDVKAVSDDEFGTGRHRVTVSYRIDGQHAKSSFMVEPSGTLGPFTTWRFAANPLGVLRVTVQHADTFTVGSHTLNTRVAPPKNEPSDFSTEGDYFVFVPSRLTLAHKSPLLSAASTATLVSDPDTATEATVDAQPTKAFTKTVQKELDTFLAECTKQTVLKPTGCPFGTEIDDRVKGDPEWSITVYPPVELTAGRDSWQSAPATGVARIRVEVQSLYDGDVSTVERDIEFVVRLEPVTIDVNGNVHIQLAGS